MAESNAFVPVQKYKLTNIDIIHVLSSPMEPWLSFDVSCNLEEQSLLISCGKFKCPTMKFPFDIPTDAESVLVKINEIGEFELVEANTDYPRMIVNNPVNCRWYARDNRTIFEETSDGISYVTDRQSELALDPLNDVYECDDEKYIMSKRGCFVPVAKDTFDFTEHCSIGDVVIDHGRDEAYGVISSSCGFTSDLPEAEYRVYIRSFETLLGIIYGYLVILTKDNIINIVERRMVDGNAEESLVASFDVSFIGLLDYEDYEMLPCGNAVTDESVILNSKDGYCYVINIKNLMFHFIGNLDNEEDKVPKPAVVPYVKFQSFMTADEMENDEGVDIESVMTERFENFRKLAIDVMEEVVPEGVIEVEYR